MVVKFEMPPSCHDKLTTCLVQLTGAAQACSILLAASVHAHPPARSPSFELVRRHHKGQPAMTGTSTETSAGTRAGQQPPAKQAPAGSRDQVHDQALSTTKGSRRVKKGQSMQHAARIRHLLEGGKVGLGGPASQHSGSDRAVCCRSKICRQPGRSAGNGSISWGTLCTAWRLAACTRLPPVPLVGGLPSFVDVDTKTFVKTDLS